MASFCLVLYVCLGGVPGLLGADQGFVHIVRPCGYGGTAEAACLVPLRSIGTNHGFIEDSVPSKVLGRMFFRAWLLQGPRSALLLLVLKCVSSGYAKLTKHPAFGWKESFYLSLFEDKVEPCPLAQQAFGWMLMLLLMWEGAAGREGGGAGTQYRKGCGAEAIWSWGF